MKTRASKRQPRQAVGLNSDPSLDRTFDPLPDSGRRVDPEVAAFLALDTLENRTTLSTRKLFPDLSQLPIKVHAGGLDPSQQLTVFQELCRSLTGVQRFYQRRPELKSVIRALAMVLGITCREVRFSLRASLSEKPVWCLLDRRLITLEAAAWLCRLDGEYQTKLCRQIRRGGTDCRDTEEIKRLVLSVLKNPEKRQLMGSRYNFIKLLVEGGFDATDDEPDFDDDEQVDTEDDDEFGDE